MAELFLVPPVSPLDADRIARATALDDADSFLVEAPAGSGKTGLLIQRFLKLLAAENVTQPEQIRAITFTREASAEMRDRVLAQLQAAADATEPRNAFDGLTRPLALAALDRDRRLGWQLLANPRRLKIGTIDSLCLEIARALPVLSGLAGALKPTTDAAPLYAEAARRTLMQLGGPDTRLSNALEELLLHRDASLPECERLIASMLGWRDQWGDLIPLAGTQLEDAWLDEHLLPSLNRALDLAICRGLTRLEQAIPRPILFKLAELAADWSGLDGHPAPPSPIALCAGRHAPPEAVTSHLEHWRALIHLILTKDGDFRQAKGIHKGTLRFLMEKHHRQDLAELIDAIRDDEPLRVALCSIDSLPPETFPAEQWKVTRSLFRILSRALVELQLVFADHGQCDFTEFALLARSALKNDTALDDLRAAAGMDLQHLLVDEMQDTSNNQYELIELLTQRWDARSQTVFLVGDPKQSIYLFRQARVERFLQTMHSHRLGDLPLETLRLSLNFRSQAHLVDAFNEDFARIFPPSSDRAQADLVPYSSVQAACPPAEEAARIWHGTLLPYTSDKKEAAARTALQRIQDAEEIRRILTDWRARPLPPDRHEPWKIAILVRGRSHLPEIVNALKQPEPIPYRAVEIEPLAERQEILDLLALTRALLHPADRTAWLALLRSPWCGLTLADLYLLAGAGDLGVTVLQLLESRGDLLSEDGIARLTPFYRILQAALAGRARDRIAAWVEQTWRDFNTHHFLTQEQLANANTYFALLDELEQPGGRLNLTTLATRLDKLYAAATVHPGAVDLMTIHGAKGLEWDLVLLPALECKEPVAHARLLTWMETEPADSSEGPVARGILAPIQGKGNASEQLNRWMRSVESAREAAERKRLFYVACTRARQELHLFAAPTAGKSGEPSVSATSLLSAAWPAAESHLQPHPAPLLVMPAPPQPGTLTSLAAAASPPLPPIERIPLAAFTTPRPAAASAPLLLPFTRPEGSYSARAFGNTVHAMLEQIALRLAEGSSPEQLVPQLSAWHSRIFLTLRASGLPPSSLERLTQHVLLALRNTLADPVGRWLLAPHPFAASEHSLALAGQPDIRVDRTFHAGPEPLSSEPTHLWIVDFKTAEAGGRDLPAFLATERTKYAAQMQTYANAFSSQPLPVRPALYYPLLSQLILD